RRAWGRISAGQWVSHPAPTVGFGAWREPTMGAVVMVVVVALALAVAAVGSWALASAARRTFDAGLASTGAELRRLADAAAWREDGTKEVRREVSSFREALSQMQAREEERRAREEEGWAVLHRVASVLAG